MKYGILHTLTEIKRTDPQIYEELKQKAIVLEFFPAQGIWHDEGFKSEYTLLAHNLMIHGRSESELNELELKLREPILKLMQEGFHILIIKPDQRQHSYRKL